jgi:hypothetical protein
MFIEQSSFYQYMEIHVDEYLIVRMEFSFYDPVFVLDNHVASI